MACLTFNLPRQHAGQVMAVSAFLPHLSGQVDGLTP